MRAKLISGKGKNYFKSVISFFILFIILFQSPFGIGVYSVNTQEIEDEDDGLCPTCPTTSESLLAKAGKKRRVGTDLDKLEKIKKAIKKKGAKWVAGETQVSRYNFEEQTRLVGTKFKSIPVEEERLTAPLGFESLGAFDWRDVDGINWMTPVRDQGPTCGSCWAFGTLGSMEAVINIVYDNPTIDMDLSEQTLVSCSDAGSCDGGYPDEAYEYIMDVGIPDEACFPYEAADVPCNWICPDFEERSWYIIDFDYVSNDHESIKWALQTYGPLGVAMCSPDDWFYYTSGIYEPVYASSKWNNTFTFGQANHWVTLVGYDDNEEYWTVRNSWGTGWGLEGYGNIAYGVLEDHNHILAINSVEGQIDFEHDLAVSVQVPTYILPGEDHVLGATVYNYGLSDETDVELFLSVNGTPVDSLYIPSLPAGVSESIILPCSPTVEGWYEITAYSPPVPGEDFTRNNIDTKWTVVPREILLVVDDDGYYSIDGTSREEFESALTYAGFDYIVWKESAHGNPSLEFLNTFDLVIWTCGDFWEGAVDPVDAGNLISYVSQGGNLLLEGEDIGFDHEDDDFMIKVAHATMEVDGTGAGGLTVTNPDHTVTQGLPTILTWSIDPPYDDGVYPTNGGFEVLKYTGTDYTAVTVYEGIIDGKVVYYSFPLYCLDESESDILVVNSVNWLALGVISINIYPSDINFGTIYEGSSGTNSVTITNDGNVVVSIKAMLESEDPVDFYTDNLKMDEIELGYVYVVEWNLVLPSKYEQSIPLELTIPYPCPAGDKTAILVFWAEIT